MGMIRIDETFLLYQGERKGIFSINSRFAEGEKYRVRQGYPFGIYEEDLWIASLPGYKVLSLINFVPMTIRVPNPDESYLTRWEASLLEGLASSLPNPARVVEIGTGKGISLGRLLIGLSHHTDVIVWSIDIEKCEKAREYVQECQIPNWRYHLVTGDSAEIGRGWDGLLDMIYLDGNHSYEGISADVDAWGQYIKQGGASQGLLTK
jgi:hypothetical protein